MWEPYLELARSLGADEATVIDPARVVTAAWVRHKCQFGCDRYGKSRCCPPYTPDWRQTRDILDGYRTAILLRCTGWNSTEIAGKVSQKLFFDGHYKAIAFGSGFCRLCKQCLMDACPHRMEAFPSMEACSIDVFATARGQGMPIEVLEHIDDPHNTYALILVE